LTESLRFARHVFEHEHQPQRDDGAGNVATMGSIIDALRNVAQGIELPALRRDMAEQGARISQRSQRHDIGDLQRPGQGPRPVRTRQRNVPHSLRC
jgi:hypothetical protein